jgi:hypothetical protein
MARAIKPVTVATELYAVISAKKALMEQLKPLEDREEELRSVLLANLKQQGVKHLKLDSGAMFVRAFRTTLKVADDAAAMVWATERRSLKVDTAKALKIIRLSGDDIPECFERQDTEYLTVKRGVNENENEE